MRLEGKNKVIGYLKRFERQVFSEVTDAMYFFATRTAAKAKSRLQPKADSEDAELSEIIANVRQSIGYEMERKGDTITITIFSGAVEGDNIAAYLEFGTGEHARSYLSGKPDWLVKWARTFFETGKGTLKNHEYLYPTLQEEFPRMYAKLKGLRPKK